MVDDGGDEVGRGVEEELHGALLAAGGLAGVRLHAVSKEGGKAVGEGDDG